MGGNRRLCAGDGILHLEDDRMSKQAFVRRACCDLGITVTTADVPYNANIDQIMKAREDALSAEYGKEE